LVNFGFIPSKYYFIQHSDYRNIISNESWVLCIFLLGILLLNIKGIYKSLNITKYVIFSVISAVFIFLYCPASCFLISILYIPPNLWIILDFLGAVYSLVFLLCTINDK